MELEQSSTACEKEVHHEHKSAQHDGTDMMLSPPSENESQLTNSLDDERKNNCITLSNDQDDNEIPDNISADKSKLQESPDLPVLPTCKPLRQRRWHTAGQLYHIITNATDVNEDVPPGDK